jgi:hypothetical protein
MRKAVFFVSAFLLLAATPPQAASAAAEECPAGSVCVWTGAGYSGPMAKTARPTKACVPGISRSALNRSSDLTIMLWAGADCSGESSAVAPGENSSVVDPPWRSVEVGVRAAKCLIAIALCL